MTHATISATATAVLAEAQVAPPAEGAASFYARFLETVERWPEQVAVEVQRSDPAAAPERYTYAELRRMAESVGRWLEEQGLQRGARCAILAENGERWVAAHLGTVAAGMVAVPFDTAFKTEQVATLLGDSGSQVLFADQRHLETAQAAAQGKNIRIVLLTQGSGQESALPHLDAMFAAGPGKFVPAAVQLDDTAVLLYTSGTTSDPKGVVLSHDNLLAEIEAVFHYIDLGPRDAILGVLPLFHALAQMANLLLPLAAGTRVVYLESLNTTELLRALKERQITLFCCVPQFFYLIHDRILSQVQERGRLAGLAFRLLLAVSRAGRRLGLNPGKVFFAKAHDALGKNMRFLITGGSRFDPEIGHNLEALGFNILQAYGLTETSGGAFATPPTRIVMGSVGPPMRGVDVKIGEAVEEEEGEGRASGEVLIRGRLVMKGYYRRLDATQAVLRDGWLHTGDLGYLDDDGNLFLTGRKKDVIVLSSGKNIYPEEVEAHYAKSSWIKEICVLGMESRPGEPLSEHLHAVIVPNFDLLKEKKIVNTREVIRFDLDSLSAQLPGSKRILSYELWQEDLPRTTTRKLKRYEIRKMVRAGKAMMAATDAEPERELSAEDAAWLDEPDVRRAMMVVREHAKEKKERIHPADNLELDLGLDSMSRVELLVALEQELGAAVDDAVVSQVYTVRELVEAVRAGMGTAPKRSAFAGWEGILATESTDPEVLAVAQPRPISTATWFFLGSVANLLMRDLFHLKITGLEKLPRSGPFILSPNHQSFLEGPLLPAMMPWRVFRDLFYVGTSEIFGTGFWRWLGRTFKLIPVDPDANLVPAMRAGAYGLKRGKILMLYPEGERSIDGVPRTFKKGAAILAAHLKVPIYPVALDGFHDAWPRGKRFQKFAPLKVAIGDPIYPPEHVDNPEATYERLTQELKARVMEMWLELHGEKPETAKIAHAAD